MARRPVLEIVKADLSASWYRIYDLQQKARRACGYDSAQYEAYTALLSQLEVAQSAVSHVHTVLNTEV